MTQKYENEVLTAKFIDDLTPWLIMIVSHKSNEPNVSLIRIVKIKHESSNQNLLSLNSEENIQEHSIPLKNLLNSYESKSTSNFEWDEPLESDELNFDLEKKVSERL